MILLLYYFLDFLIFVSNLLMVFETSSSTLSFAQKIQDIVLCDNSFSIFLTRSLGDGPSYK